MSQYHSLSLLFIMITFAIIGCESGEPSGETDAEIPETPEVVERPKVEYDQEINWLTWEEAYKKSQTDKKKVFVDLYTDWCGWCKRMDKTTFQDPEVKKFLNENFHAVKFNAEQKEPLTFRDVTFEFTKAGRKGAHGLAVALLNGRLGYPSFVFLDENFDKIDISPGYKQPVGLLKELKWVVDDGYMSETLQEYLNSAD